MTSIHSHPITVFGSSGQLGLSLAQELEASRFTYKLLSRPAFSVKDSVATLKQRISRGSLVINCVAMTDVDACQRETTANQLVNHCFASRLGAACQEQGAYLIQISTDYVFSSGNYRWETHDRPMPENAYGAAKLQAEKDVLSTGGSIVRTSMLFSEHGGFPSRLLVNARSNRQVRLPGNLYGTPTSARTLARWLISCATEPPVGSIEHFCSVDSVSRSDFGRAVLKLVGSSARVSEFVHDESVGQAKRPTHSSIQSSITDKAWARNSAEMLSDYEWDS